MLKGTYRIGTGELTADGATASFRQGELAVYFSGRLFNLGELGTHDENEAAVVARLYQAKGFEGLAALNGPFVLAVLDGRKLLLARDQIGQGNLYFRQDNGQLRFAEDVNALEKGTDRDGQALADYLSLGYIPAPRTLWKSISKLQNGTAVTFGDDGRQKVERFWKPALIPMTGISWDEAAEEAHRLIVQAIRRCLAVDSRPGFLLSGGIDSTLMLALTAEAVPEAYKCFTVGFDNPRYDERALAALVARHIDVPHYTQQVEPAAFESMRELMRVSGEPFADSSLLPDYCAMKLAEQHCGSVMMGDGGDEMFGGYRRYRIMALRNSMGEGLAACAGAGGALLSWLLPNAAEGRTALSSIARLARAFRLPPVPCYASFQELFAPDELNVLAPDLAKQTEPYYARWLPIYEQARGARGANLVDLDYYLPDDGCRKEGIAAQAAGMQCFAPLLDMDVVRFALSLPFEHKLNLRRGKLLLRQLGEKRLPQEIFRQVKRGFGMPVASWLRNGLKPELLGLPERLQSLGCFDGSAVERYISEHLSGKRDHGARLWALLALAFAASP